MENCKPKMEENFNMIIPRLEDSFSHLDFDKARKILKSIRHSCLCAGVGGSSAASLFASIILDNKNGIIATSKEARNILFTNIFGRYGHFLGITYGNNNYGIDEAELYCREGKMDTHLITANSNCEDDICYKGELPKEKSFISLASTITPMAIMLAYYLNNDKNKALDLIREMYLHSKEIANNMELKEDMPIFDIISGDDTYVAANILESTITEAGLGIPHIGEKYSYCHGRSTMPYELKKKLKKCYLIYLINGDYSNLDKMELEELKSLYSSVTVLNSKEKDKMIGEFDLSLRALTLCRMIAEQEEKDLSRVDYYPEIGKFYTYRGGM